ncbi:MAG: metal ABC transporter substrate-binding protein, partial [Johnsonella sp.]|nr:metal ABC transporter substrate-binding protein [Johnsonella sp.]
ADHDHDEHADHDHEEHADHDDHDHDHEHVVDEHVWLSLENAKLLVATIEKALGSVDAENAALYQKNAQEYIAKLAKLDEQYEEAADSAKHKHIVFGDRFPFRYLADDYDIEYHAAFVGCSAETEASFETVAFLANKVDELGVPAVLTIEKSNQKIAKTIIENTESKNQEIKVMNSLQSVTSADIESGVSYLSVMEQNLEVLKQVLN